MGTNTLTFRVINSQGLHMGLNVQAWLCCDSTIILPNTCTSPCTNPEEVIMSGVPGIGVVDPDWTVSSIGGSVAQAVGAGPASNYGWQTPFAGTNWISVSNPPL